MSVLHPPQRESTPFVAPQLAHNLSRPLVVEPSKPLPALAPALSRPPALAPGAAAAAESGVAANVAPAASSNAHTSPWPAMRAMSSGPSAVTLFPLTVTSRFASAPAARSACTTPAWPSAAATASGNVLPISRVSSPPSGSAPAASNSATTSRLPLCAAQTIG